MDVRCERCRAEYAVDETRIPEAGVKVACTSCGHGFLLRKRTLAIAVPLKAGDGDTTTPLPDLAPGGAVSAVAGGTAGRGEWKLRQASGAVFPFRELSTLQRWIVERKAGRTDEIAQVGPGETWRRLGEIPELASFFELVDRARSRRDPTLEPEPEAETERARGPGTEDPAWAQGHTAPPRRVTRPIPMPRRPRRPLLWVSGLALALLGVAAVTVYLHRKAAADLAAQAGPPPAAKVAAPVAAAPVVPVPAAPASAVEPRQEPGPASADPPRIEPAPQPSTAAAAAPTGPERVEPAAAPATGAAPAETPATATAAPAATVAPATAVVEPRPPVRPAAPTPAATLRTTLARAREQRDRGRCEAALELYGQALGIDGRNATALAGRGACYLELSRYAMAEASFEAALDADPRNAEALFGLGETYRYMGRKAEAVALYERFLAVRPTGDEAAAARRLVAQLKE